MCRVKKGKVTKPSVAPPPRRRGRPAIDWTRSRKRRLLRLYLCTPEAELSLKKILEILAEGPFQPKPRHTQCLLNDMLSKSYRQKRPKNRTSMGERLGYLRSVRAGRPQADPHAAAPSRQVIKDCAVLLKADPGGPKSNTQARDTSGEPDDPDSPGSPTDRRPDTASTSSNRSLDTAAEPRTSLESEDADAKEPSPDMFRNPWSSSSSSPYEDMRCEKGDFLRERCPSRSSSFLADVASLLSGLSIRSSLSRSSSGSSRRSVRSCSSRTEASGSGVRGDWEGGRPLAGASMMEEGLGWSAAASSYPSSTTAWVHQTPTAAPHPPNPIPTPNNTTTNNTTPTPSSTHTLENLALVRACCSKTPTHLCIHQRITTILTHPHAHPPTTFTCTAAEANTTDALGNTALHVAARWGAPGAVLQRILALAARPDATNRRGETFLHVLDPAALGAGDLGQVVEVLAGRGFGFGLVDEGGRGFVERLMDRRGEGGGFGLESLEAVFCRLPEAERLALFGVGGSGGRGLVDAIRARLVGGEPAQTVEAAEAYCRYFVARYGTPAAGAP